MTSPLSDLPTSELLDPPLPAGLPGLDPAWSRAVRALDADGVERTWHVLDNAPSLAGPAQGTVLCVHGNPTWAYLWRSVLAAGAARGWRVVAVDHLDMGFSERTGTLRPLARRIDDLGRVVDALGLEGPVVTLAHDWGGIVSLGWALAHRDRLAGVVLCNTAVSEAGAALPAPLRLARADALLRFGTTTTPAFLETTLALAHPPLAREVKEAFRAPYRRAERRRAVGDFVADIPLEPDHGSRAALLDVAGRLGELADVPVLLLWGPRDPVFSDRYLRDLRARLPHADVHRFEGAGHLLPEDADVAGTLLAWLGSARVPAAPPLAPAVRPLSAALEERRADPGPAVVELGEGARTVSWAQLATRVDELAAGLLASGVRRGDRVALLVPPGTELTSVVYACLRIGAVIVVADAGLGLPGLHRAVRGAGPAHVVGIARALVAARALGWPGSRFLAGPGRALRLGTPLDELARRGRAALATTPLPPPPGPTEEAAVLFTSGSTGPAKGVVYTVAQLAAVRDLLAAAYAVGPGTRLVAGFAPFALFGPALGAVSAVPDMDVTAPRTLSATALADAVAAVGATVVFASPAALAGVLATRGALDPARRRALEQVELLLSAGAPVPAALLRQVQELVPRASLHTPYGMTEALPVTDIDLVGIEEAGSGDGVCVGHPLPGVEVALAPLTSTGTAPGPLVDVPDVLGEIAVRGAHVKERYDQLWLAERASTRDAGWHRTGDVGHLDAEGRLWVEGRLAHLVLTAEGPVAPVGTEQRLESVPAVSRAALVGVGPAGAQRLVAVVEAPGTAAGVAPLELADACRAAAGRELVAVLVVAVLPTDIRHNSKIDRTRVARWAQRVLAGERVGRP
ncbi:acyl-CoA synthetase (AMP-forming)/AMP-acid ligase II [Motilibacter rhizosphaerae]|uniref:Acyl-CoA synthetase (AMP-forming)/AMP-acid ligase II n=1 Tax=Motilibacter rhizosphaerae TaxID=598652 RepID=A0A4Q7NVQ8_9ACTN|nr:alpha/beta fold hydrolase [Motilibacter rhizosphaerae]RZS91277.1 acyl-CoA synthetase (AMP-forming)/AMP-acid ligase II [Motilibacter rhizosphaerae]